MTYLMLYDNIYLIDDIYMDGVTYRHALLLVLIFNNIDIHKYYYYFIYWHIDMIINSFHFHVSTQAYGLLPSLLTRPASAFHY